MNNVARIGDEQNNQIVDTENIRSQTQNLVPVADFSFYQVKAYANDELEQNGTPITEEYQSEALDRLSDAANDVETLNISRNYLTGPNIFVTKNYNSKICSKLSKLKKLDISNNDFTEGKVLECIQNSPIEELDFSHNSLVSFELIIDHVRQLLLGYNRLSQLTLFGTVNLQEVDLSYNKLEAKVIEDGLLSLNLPHLRILRLNNNKIVGNRFPNVGSNKCAALEEIYIDCNEIEGLNDEFFSVCTSLRIVSASENKLTSTPNFFDGKYSALTQVILNNNSLRALPDIVYPVPPIETLYIHNNELEYLPEAIGLFGPTLKDISLQSNKLTTLPSSIGDLVQLSALYAFRNQLNELPSEIGKLVNLTELDVFGNNLCSLPKEIGNLVNLKRLCVDDNKLESIPNDIMNCANLYLFTFEGNKELKITPFLSMFRK
jgi:Leucine-rich repeat (LRR) protein